MNPSLFALTSAFGLTASAGLNTTLPLLLVGLLARFGQLHLTAPFDALSSDVALGELALLAVLEFVADKIPGADSLVQTIQLSLAGGAGAILFASQTAAIDWLSPGLSIVVGLITAGAVHGVRTTARPVVTGLSLGMGNPLVSLLEDGFAVALTLAAILVPLVGLILLLILVAFCFLVGSWTARRIKDLLRFVRRRGES